MKLHDLVVLLDDLAPLELAEEWDNVGLLAGDPDQTVRRVLLTIDLTGDVLAEARKLKTDLILAYHPPIFEPLKTVVKDRGVSPLLYEVIRSGMAVYAFHTALDSVRGGVNDLLADVAGIADAQPLQSQGFAPEKMCKIAVYLPEYDLDKISSAIFKAGAGHIDNYSHCSFRAKGTGTFQGAAGTNPTVGKPGRLEQAPELRLESIVPVERLQECVAAMIAAHSYEEVAYDVYPLLHNRSHLGLGRFGDLKKPVSKKALIETVKKKLKVNTVGLIGPSSGQARRGAVCAGSCGSVLKHVIRNKCDFYLTGELNHHNALKLQEAGGTTVCVSHSNSERLVLRHVAKKLKPQCPGLQFTVSKRDKDPFTWG
jgi:dinuclear metal center YbgI/SA1388 family protein